MALQHGLMTVPVKACDEWAVPLWRRFLQVNECYERVNSSLLTMAEMAKAVDIFRVLIKIGILT